ncbi:solute carrier family 43 member 3-like isoform X1 [Lytechinus variegatus]|uniref:solute carrier family 43 member 3-like isoform X1 n=1 Tax=Lytechinus variegatus TaxID=7654 RepID=UPI001BB2C728|nr:solute carrier family 43 member 3-like isoform X1 [Lytechinus variegatus]
MVIKAVLVTERLLALVFVCFENLIHGGIIFGWPSLVFVYIQLGYFSDLCYGSSENSTSSTEIIGTTAVYNRSRDTDIVESCPEQESRIQLVFSVAVAVQAACMFPVGFLFDHYGTRLSRLVMSILMLVGYILMAFSSPTYSILVFPGTICFTIGGVIMLFSSMQQIGNLFEGQKSTIITLINAMYGGSVIMFFVAKIVHDAGFSINLLFFIMAGSVVLLNINTFLILPTKYIPWPLPDGYRLITCGTPRNSPKATEKSAYDNQGYIEDPFSEGVDGNGYNRQTSELSARRERFKRSRKTSQLSLSMDTRSETNEDGVCETEERKEKEFGSLCSCLLSVPFFLLLFWQAFLETGVLFTFGTLNFFLTRLSNGDEDLVSWYINVFAITQFFILIVGPLGGLLMDRNTISCSKREKQKRRGPYAEMRDSCLPLAITTLASIGYSICLLIPSLQLQYLTFIFILVMKSLLFGVGSAVVAVVFPMKYFTSVYGAMRTMSGFFTFLQYPIFILLQRYLDDDPFWVTIAFIVADVCTFTLPAALYVISKRKE